MMSFKGATSPNTSGPPTGDDMDLVATHLRLLVAAFMRTQGDVLELGCGWYSTPVLHELCRAAGRRLLTFDNQPYWLPPFMPFASKGHELKQIGWWQEMYEHFPPDAHFGMAFVDQGQPIEREYAVRRLLAARVVDVFVMHDTEEGHAYGYDRLLGLARYPGKEEEGGGLFKYQWTDRSQAVWTTVASNKIDVTKWGLIQLAEHDKSEQIT